MGTMRLTSQTAEQVHVVPLCEYRHDGRLCWKRSIYLHGDGNDFGLFLCGGHHPKNCIETRHCSRLILAMKSGICLDCPEDDQGLSLVHCTACQRIFCFLCWVEHWHMSVVEEVA